MRTTIRTFAVVELLCLAAIAAVGGILLDGKGHDLAQGWLWATAALLFFLVCYIVNSRPREIKKGERDEATALEHSFPVGTVVAFIFSVVPLYTGSATARAVLPMIYGKFYFITLPPFVWSCADYIESQGVHVDTALIIGISIAALFMWLLGLLLSMLVSIMLPLFHKQRTA
jgi:hypothetical protein